MPGPIVAHSTFVLTRSYPQSPQKVFAALSDPAKKRRWFAGGEGNDVEAFEMDFRLGGAERVLTRLGPKTPFPGAAMETHASYLQIVADRLVVIAQAMDFAGRRISAALITFELAADGDGAKLTLTHQAAFFEGADGTEMRRAGWEALLDRLGRELAI